MASRGGQEEPVKLEMSLAGNRVHKCDEKARGRAQTRIPVPMLGSY